METNKKKKPVRCRQVRKEQPWLCFDSWRMFWDYMSSQREESLQIKMQFDPDESSLVQDDLVHSARGLTERFVMDENHI